MIARIGNVDGERRRIEAKKEDGILRTYRKFSHLLV
jgi:hypothetical protein